MQRIKEFNWDFLYQHVLSDVIKNSIALYMMELLYKCLKQPEQNIDLFSFCEDALHELDIADKKTAANFPLFFALHLPQFFGFRIHDNYSETKPVLDLQEGSFASAVPHHPHFIDGENAFITSQLLKTMHPVNLAEIKLNHETRRKLLLQYQDYYALHIAEFGQMKTLSVLHEVL
jgi:DNA repair protein RecO (recombination protein O)